MGKEKKKKRKKCVTVVRFIYLFILFLNEYFATSVFTAFLITPFLVLYLELTVVLNDYVSTVALPVKMRLCRYVSI